MDARYLPIILLLAVAAIGCKNDPYVDAYFDMLNAEKRVLEDRLYETQYNYEKALRELEAYRNKQAPEVEDTAPEPEPADPAEDEVPEFPEIELPPGFSRRNPEADGQATQALAVSAAEQQLPQWDMPDDQRVHSIRLNARRTGALDIDGQPGDDALSVLVEPRNREGLFVPKAGSLSLVLLDPLKRGESARFARWDLERNTVQNMLSKHPLERGLHVLVPWPEVPPDTDRLHLFVRYADDDGHQVEAEQEITVRSPDRVADRWTPRAENPISRTVKRRREMTPASSVERDSPVAPVHYEEPVPDAPPLEGPSTGESSADAAAATPGEWSPKR